MASPSPSCHHEGYLDKESKNSKWNRRFFVLEPNCLRYFKDNPEKLPEEERQSRGEIRLKRISTVDVSTTKEHRSCMELQTVGGPIYLAAYSDTERQQWIDSIRLASKRLTMQHSSSTADMSGGLGSLSLDEGQPASATAGSSAAATSGSSAAVAAKPDTYGTRTKVVGGVVVRLPMKSEGDASVQAERTSDCDSHPDRVMSVGAGTSASAGAVTQQPLTPAGSGTLASGHRRDGARVVKSGYCVKQGHVRKNWKKRFFLLDPFGFAYYSSDSEKDFIKNINIQDILAVSECGNFTSKSNVFQLVTNGSIYYIQAPSEQDMREWVSAIEGELHGAVKTTDKSKSNRRSMKG